MRARLLTASRWVLCLVIGSLFGAVRAVVELVQGEGWVGALISGAVGGLVFGGVFGAYSYARNQRLLTAVGQLPAGALRTALRAAMRGPVLIDPQVRAAARAVAESQLDEVRRGRTALLVTFGVFLLLNVGLALTDSPWWWLGVGVWLALLLSQLWLPGHLQRRSRLLANA